jgi:aspartyl protease family protein
MRTNIIVVAVLVAVGVYVARFADKAVAPAGRNDSGGVGTTTHSSSVTTIPAPSAQIEQSASAASQNRLPEIVRLSPASKAVTLRSDKLGHFKVEARVDGRHLDFLVDTGASAVALRESDAARLNIHPRESDYKVKTQTANGIGYAAIARINVIEIENIVVRDVVAFVHPDKLLSENLLGMTFLSRIRFTYDRGKLILDQ